MKKILLIPLLLFCTMVVMAQDGSRHVVMFYNVENLFDIYDDPNVRDEEFTPDGPKKWTETKYREKISRIGEVIYNVAGSNRTYPAVIGFSEVENRRVLDDIVSDSRLIRANYQIVHYDSPEARGVDVALIYRPDVFKVEWSDAFQPVIPEEPEFKTRDILAVCGTIEGERFCFFVNHWSSRRGGSAASEYLRVGCASTLKRYADSLVSVYPDIKIVMMGDMNDDPNNRSLAEVVGGKENISEVGNGEYFNPFREMHRRGMGTLGYQDAWNLFDNMIVNSNLLPVNGTGTLRICKANGSRYYGNIFKRPFMVQQKGKFKNYPLRTYSGNSYLGGYSDHFPVFILIGK